MTDPLFLPPAQFDLKLFLKQLTRQPGVYQMYDVQGRILYVGKAKNLKNRVSSYFHSTGLSAKTQSLVQKIHSIEITIATSEAEALLLEHNLIKAQRPPYNISLRDDKSYPYIYLSQDEDYPRLALHRGPKKLKGRYFGPFPNSYAVRDSLQLMQKIFRVRQCEDSVYRNRSRPCLQYQIGRCTGPCVKLITTRDYALDVEHSVLFLEGKNETLHQALVTKMEVAAEQLQFEQAVLWRDQITHLRHVQAQHSSEQGQGNLDIVACAIQESQVCVHILFIRQGRVLGSKSYFPKDLLGAGESTLLSEFLMQFYLTDRGLDLPKDIVVSHPLQDAEALMEALKQLRQTHITITDKVRTHKARWQAMAIEAAKQNLLSRLNRQDIQVQKWEALQHLLGWDEPPERIECFDISHSSGELPTASCVVFQADGALKAEYRRFNIEGIQPGDDYAAMAQAIQRRYTRLQKENKPLPSLLIVDGGKGQLTQAQKVLAELGIDSISLMGIAKGTTRKPGFETLIFADGDEQTLTNDQPALQLLQQIRDEAHRFAITGHTQARDKKRRHSRLEDVAGIGPRKRKQLLLHFGGIQEVMAANVEDLAKVPGISKKLAQEVYSTLHSE